MKFRAMLLLIFVEYLIVSTAAYTFCNWTTLAASVVVKEAFTQDSGISSRFSIRFKKLCGDSIIYSNYIIYIYIYIYILYSYNYISMYLSASNTSFEASIDEEIDDTHSDNTLA